MRKIVLGLLVGAGFGLAVAATFSPHRAVYAQRPVHLPAANGFGNGQLIALHAEGTEGQQQVTLIDPQQRVMSVYHINTGTGSITLRGVRNLRWDLLMEEFNGASPSPQEIRSLIEPK